MWPGLKSDIKKKKKSATKYKKEKGFQQRHQKSLPYKTVGQSFHLRTTGLRSLKKKKNCQLSRSKENMAIKDAKGNTNQ